MTRQRRWHERRAVRALVAAALILAVLAACGEDDDADVVTSTTTGAVTTSSTTSPSTTSRATTSPPTTDEQEAQAFDVYLLPAEADDCSTVVPVRRTATVEGPLGDALAQLLAGPTAEEEAQGLRSWFSDATRGMLNGVVIQGGTAEIDFDDFSQLIPNASSSCGSASLLAQLDSTVLQFEGVDRAVYSFGGNRAAFYEWLQLSAPE